jgi:hypothetical protein
MLPCCAAGTHRDLAAEAREDFGKSDGARRTSPDATAPAAPAVKPPCWCRAAVEAIGPTFYCAAGHFQEQYSPSPELRKRIKTERRIARAVVKDLTRAGWFLAIHDGGAQTIKPTQDRAAVLRAMFTTDEDYILAFQSADARRHSGMVRFVYGNDGWDVISDYTCALESDMRAALAVVDKLEARS